jgi:hypothetical protein
MKTGSALAAVKALSREVYDLHGEIGELHGENARLQSRLAGLERGAR